jgi:hypothetical protein
MPSNVIPLICRPGTELLKRGSAVQTVSAPPSACQRRGVVSRKIRPRVPAVGSVESAM